jgi:hypothetical protein
MRTRSLLLTALIAAAAALGSGAPAQADEDRQNAAPNLALIAQPREAGSDIVAGRGPNPHARELRSIAIHESVGNRQGAEITASSLHQFGISRQAIAHAVDRTKVHATSRDEPEPGY